VILSFIARVGAKKSKKDSPSVLEEAIPAAVIIPPLTFSRPSYQKKIAAKATAALKLAQKEQKLGKHFYSF
jgi:hypothetical protein